MQGKRGPILACGTALLLAAAFSGCFMFKSLKLSPSVISPGEKIKALVSVVPETSDTGVKDKMVPFVVVGVDEQQGIEVSGARKFDTKGKFGGPYPMFEDAALRNVAIDDPDCGLGSGTLNEVLDIEWTLLRTDDEVNDRDSLKAAQIKVGIDSSGSSSDGQYQVYVFAGNWSEGASPNNVPEEAEVACSGGSITNYTVAG